VFQGGDVSLYTETFHGHSTVASLRTQWAAKVSAGTPRWQFVGADETNPDEFEAAHSMVAGGYDGSSHAYRQSPDFGARQQPSMYSEILRATGESWATHPPGTRLFVRVVKRHSLTNLHWIKGLELFHSSERTQYGYYLASGTQGFANIHPRSNNREIYMPAEGAGAVGAPPIGMRRFTDVNDGAWHDHVYSFLPSSGAGETDGINRWWVDGHKIVDASLDGLNTGWMEDRQTGVDADSTDPFPGNVGDKWTNVTGLQALEGLSHLAVTGRIIIPGIYNGLTASGGGTYDIGRVDVWYRP